jgi:hypothetical protein
VFLVEGYQGADTTPELNELVEGSKTIEWQGASLTLQREAYVVVDLAAMPGLPLLLLGGLVLLAGVGVAAWAGLTRTWLNAAVDGAGTLLAVRVAAPALGQAAVSRVAASLAAPAAAPPAGSSRSMERGRTTLYVLGGAAGFALVGGLALRVQALPAQPWILFVYAGLALLGLGALLAGAIQSLWFALRGSRLSDVTDPALPGTLQGLRSRPGDPGRRVSLAVFPLLTAALLLGSGWGLFVYASPVKPVAGQMWLLAAWLLASAYFHATSGWRPPRVPPWLAPILVMAAVAAGIAACLAASSMFTF